MSTHTRRNFRRWSWRLRWWPWARRTLLDLANDNWQAEQDEIDKRRQNA